nr:MAG TPA: hypothetical protein [Caudoviricetes sp.]
MQKTGSTKQEISCCTAGFLLCSYYHFLQLSPPNCKS